MWNYICVSGFFLTVSFLYHYYTTIQPLSVIQYPKESYDYIVGKTIISDLLYEHASYDVPINGI